MHQRHLLAAICLSLVWLPSATVARKPSDAVLLSDVQSLTFRAGRSTSHRRVPAIPQLKCVGGSAAGLYEPELLRCINSGSSYDIADVEWTCSTSLPPEFKLGSTDVICEGYDSPADPYILKGSCGVEYRLVLTEDGEKKYRSSHKTPAYNGYDESWWGSRTKDSRTMTWLFWLFFLGVVVWMVYSAFVNGDGGAPGPRRPASAWGAGGGGGGGNDDPPPPYDPRPPYRSKPYSWVQGHAAENAWRPGFWTGTAAGAAAGYLAGQRGQRQTPRVETAQGLGGTRSGGNGEASSSGSRHTGRHGSSGSGSSYSSARYESTGFGGTARR